MDAKIDGKIFDREEDVSMPHLVFKLKGSFYAVDGQQVVSIMPLGKYESLPSAPPEILGMTKFRDKVIPIVDVRAVFGLPSLKQEYEEFVEMLEQRKKDHAHWVNVLEQSLEKNEPFPLATDLTNVPLACGMTTTKLTIRPSCFTWGRSRTRMTGCTALLLKRRIAGRSAAPVKEVSA